MNGSKVSSLEIAKIRTISVQNATEIKIATCGKQTTIGNSVYPRLHKYDNMRFFIYNVH